MARRHNFSGPRSGRKRLAQWLAPAVQGYTAVAATGATILAFASFEEPLTIVRTRGQISVRPTVATADLDIVGAFGAAIVSTEAFTAGIASVPEPFSDADWGGWYVWRSFAYSMEFGTAVGVERLSWDFEVDSKAMRKLSSNETIVFVAESIVGAFSITSSLRTLLKLS